MVGTNDKKTYDMKFDGLKMVINTADEKRLLNLIIQNKAVKNLQEMAQRIYYQRFTKCHFS